MDEQKKHMVMDKEDLLSLLKVFAISYEYYEHPPVFTVAEAKSPL